MYAGYVASGLQCEPGVDWNDIMLINAQGDQGDIANAVLPSLRSDGRALAEHHLLFPSHCSSVVRFTPDMQVRGRSGGSLLCACPPMRLLFRAKKRHAHVFTHRLRACWMGLQTCEVPCVLVCSRP